VRPGRERKQNAMGEQMTKKKKPPGYSTKRRGPPKPGSVRHPKFTRSAGLGEKGVPDKVRARDRHERLLGRKLRSGKKMPEALEF